MSADELKQAALEALAEQAIVSAPREVFKLFPNWEAASGVLIYRTLRIGFPRVLEPASELAPLSAIVRSDCVRAATRAPAGARAQRDRSP